jgi:diacylglycerol kinase family enzyme
MLIVWRVLDIMAHTGVRLEIEETRRPGHAASLASAAVAAGHSLVVAAGGDGTIAEVANGLAGSGCRLGVIPLGTANVLARELGLPFDPRAVAAALAFGRTIPVWPGMIHHDGEVASRLFVQMVGAGFDAQVVHGLDPMLKRALGRTAYVLQGLRETARYRFRPIQVRIDGAETEAASVIVTKGHLYAGDYCLAPGASPTRPGFAVALFDRAGPYSAMMYGAALPLNLIHRMPGFRLLQAHVVSILSDRVPAQADGDAAGLGPMRLTDAPGPMQVVVA